MKQDNSFINLIYEITKTEIQNNINIKLNITVGKNININKIISHHPNNSEEEAYMTSSRSINSDKNKKQNKNRIDADYPKSSRKLRFNLKKNQESGSSNELSKSFMSNPKNKSGYDFWNNSNSAKMIQRKKIMIMKLTLKVMTL